MLATEVRELYQAQTASCGGVISSTPPVDVVELLTLGCMSKKGPLQGVSRGIPAALLAQACRRQVEATLPQIDCLVPPLLTVLDKCCAQQVAAVAH